MADKALGRIGDFDIRLIRVFKAVVECGGFTAAEPELGISRSAISLHMNDLETRLGLCLCQRGRGGFALTEEGRQVYHAAQTLLASLETFRNDVTTLHRTLRGELNIGITDNLVTFPEMRITHALAALKDRGDEVRIHIHMDPPDVIAQGVLDGRLHVGVVPRVHRLANLDTRPLYDERSRLYCADTHPLFDAGSGIDWRQVDAVVPGYPIGEAARACHDRLIPAATASDREGAAFLVLTGRYIGYLPEHLAAPWVAGGRLRAIGDERCQFETPFVIIVRRERRPDRVLDTFLDVLATAEAPSR